MATVGSLVIDVTTKLASFENDMGKVKRSMQGIEKQVGTMNASLSRMEGVAKSAFAGLAASLSVGAFAGFIKSAINAADEIGKMSQKVGVAVGDLSKLSYAAGLSDVSNEQLSVGLKQLSKNLIEATSGSKEQSAAFRALGVETQNTDGTMRKTIDVFRDISDKFAGMEDGSTKTAIAMKLFGKSGADLIPLLNSGAEGLQTMAIEAEKLGVVITEKTAKAAEEFNDNLTRLTAQSKGLGIEIANLALGPMNNLANKLVQISLNSETATEKLGKFLLLGLRASPFGMAVDFKNSPLGILMGKGEQIDYNGKRLPLPPRAGQKSETDLALERYLRGLDSGGGGGRKRTSKSRSSAQKMLDDLDAARKPGGLYEWWETEQVTQSIANYQPKLQAPELEMPSFNLGFQDVAFESLEQQMEASANMRDELQLLSEKYDEVYGIKIPSFLEGTQTAWKDYAGYAADSSQQAFKAINDSLRTVEDTLVQFVMTGKMSFTDLANTIIQQMVRVAIQKTILYAIESIAGAFGGGGGLGGAVGTIVSAFNDKGNIFANGSLVPYASGGIVGSPTMFPMSGGRTGLMGEAGYEGILPLDRGPDGKLGVRARGGGGQGVNHYSVTINAIDTQTGAQFLMKNMDTIMSGMASRIGDNHPMRRMR